jgi:hypothetical protein
MPQSVYHVGRDNIVTELQRTHGYQPQDARRIVSYLEASGTVRFTGPAMLLRDTSEHDALIVEGLANGVLGRTTGSQGTYKLKEYLDYMKRKAQAAGISGTR